MSQTRKYWVNMLWQICEPVITAAAQNRLKAVMPVEAKNSDRLQVTHLEAIGRTVCGLAPWLETASEDKEEEKLRLRVAELTRRAIANAVNSNAADFCDFTSTFSAQPLVDAAFLAQGIIRAPHTLWKKADKKTQENLIAAFRQTRKISAKNNNWLLFPAMIETALYLMTGDCDLKRVNYALHMHEQWYCGDGVYGDGSNFHCDYYNSYVIQPMLIDTVRTLKHIIPNFKSEEEVLVRARRYAEIQERSIAPDGSFFAIGRSITYRTAAFQVLAQLSLLDELPQKLTSAQARCALTMVIKRCFEAPNTFDENGWLKIGLCGHQPSLGEKYISTGSLYLCTVGFLPLGLPQSHPFWKDDDTPFTSQKIWSGVDIPADHYI